MPYQENNVMMANPVEVVEALFGLLVVLLLLSVLAPVMFDISASVDTENWPATAALLWEMRSVILAVVILVIVVRIVFEAI